MRNPIWRIRALVIVALLFITGSAAAQEVTREQLIGTWWSPEDDSESVVVVLQFRDDGFMTGREISFQERGSLQWEFLYARWELENDSLTVAPIRDEDGSSSPSFTVMIAFEDEALITGDPDGDERHTFQPGGIPPEALPEGNALHGTVTYSDGPYYGIIVAVFKLESPDGSEDVFPVVHGAAVLFEQGEWDIWGLDDGVWFVLAAAFEEDGPAVASSIIASEAGDVIVGPSAVVVSDFDLDQLPSELDVIEKRSFADFDGISLEGGRQVVTGLDIVLRASGTAVEAAAWGEVKALFR